MSKGLEPCHRNVAVYLCLGAGGGCPVLVTVYHSSSVQKLRTRPRAQLECNRVSLVLQLAGRETWTAGHQGMQLLGTACATRGGSLSSVTLRNPSLCVGFWVCPAGLKSLYSTFGFYPSSFPLKRKKEGRNLFVEAGERESKISEIQSFKSFLGFLNVCWQYRWFVWMRWYMNLSQLLSYLIKYTSLVITFEWINIHYEIWYGNELMWKTIVAVITRCPG